MAGDGADSSGSQVALVTGGYDHTIKLWQAHSGVCLRTMQHPDSQVNDLEINPNSQMVAACGYQHIRMYDLASANPDPVMNFEGVIKNVSRVGFQENGQWMYTGGEDCTARIWDLRSAVPVPADIPSACACKCCSPPPRPVADHGWGSERHHTHLGSEDRPQ
ncbi:jg6916 [Pararge aegeria aegeria]|uniref:Target of rapamycin complex subunit lst8 n=1 Tax=Pararge aegeria aegeria TaxID=348720 RepID=A0A8S4S9U8_9NEOP|nr:jg6916 [Pararge aegeria aegeria]